jgi:hypothetical protein
MLFRLLADVTLLLHASFILFVVFGALLAIRWRRVMWLHIPACVWAAALEVFGLLCPLTPLENALGRAGGRVGYSDGFLDHYLIPLIYPTGLTPQLQTLLAVLLLLLNGGLYWYVLRRRRSRAPRTPPDGER